MSKYVLTLAVLAAACVPTFASAEDAQDTTIRATQLSDAEMDQVTAAGRPSWAGYGMNTAAYRLQLRGLSLPAAALANGQGYGKPQ